MRCQKKPMRIAPSIITAMVLCAFVLFGCDRRTSRPANKADPMPAPSGKYVLRVPIEANPRYDNARVWKVVILDRNGQQLYKDDDSRFVGHLNVYWHWDGEDRVWLYNSDDGVVWFWEQVNGQWTKTRWGAGTERETKRELTPPIEVFPPYARPPG